MTGANWAKAPKPTHAAEPVASWRRNGTVTFCIHMPMLDTNAPAQNRAKSRCRNARKACRSPRLRPVMSTRDHNGPPVEPELPTALPLIGTETSTGRELVPVPRPPNPGVEDLEGRLSDVDG